MVITAGFGFALSGGFGPTAERTAQEAQPVQEADAIVCGGLCIAGVAGTAAVAGGAAVWLADGDDVSKEKYEEMVDAETSQQRLDLAVTTKGAGTGAETFLTQMNNTLANSRSIASQKAKARIAQEINNGTTDVSAISTEVNETIEDYYAVHQHNLIQKWESVGAQSRYAAEAQANDTNIDPVLNITGGKEFEYDGYNKTRYTDVTTVNGSTENVSIFVWDQIKDDTHQTDYHLVFDEKSFIWYSSFNSTTPDVKIVTRAQSHSNDSLKDVSRGPAFPAQKFTEVNRGIENSTRDLKQNYGPDFVEAVLAQYKTGDINTSDLISAEILANEWGTSYNQTGSSIYRHATFAALGLDSPDINETSSIKVQYEREPTTRIIRFNTSLSGTWGESSPVNLTLGYPDGTQVGYTVLDQSGTNSPEVTIPVKDGYEYRDIDVLLSWKEGGSIESFSPGSSFTLGPNSNLSVTQERVESVNVTEWGMIFSDSAPDNGWNTSQTYQMANFTHEVYFSRTAGDLDQSYEMRHAPHLKENVSERQPVMMPFDGANVSEFTILEAVNDDGESISTVGVRDYNQQTTNVSSFTKEVKRIENVRKVIEANEPTIGGGGLFGGLGDLGSIGVPGAIVLAGGAALFILGRD